MPGEASLSPSTLKSVLAFWTPKWSVDVQGGARHAVVLDLQQPGTGGGGLLDLPFAQGHLKGVDTPEAGLYLEVSQLRLQLLDVVVAEGPIEHQYDGELVLVLSLVQTLLQVIEQLVLVSVPQLFVVVRLGVVRPEAGGASSSLPEPSAHATVYAAEANASATARRMKTRDLFLASARKPSSWTGVRITESQPCDRSFNVASRYRETE